MSTESTYHVRYNVLERLQGSSDADLVMWASSLRADVTAAIAE